MPFVNDLGILPFELTKSSKYESITMFSHLKGFELCVFVEVKRPLDYWHAPSSLSKTWTLPHHVCKSL